MKLTVSLTILLCVFFFEASCRVKRISNMRVRTAAFNGASPRKLKGLMDMITGGDSEADKKAQQQLTKQKNTMMLLDVMNRQRKIKRISHLVETLQDSLETLKSSVESEIGQLSSITTAGQSTDMIIIKRAI